MNGINKNELVDINVCDGCGEKKFSLALQADPWTLMRCNNCGLVFTTPRYSDESLKRLYSDEYYEKADSYYHQQVSPPSEEHLRLVRKIRKYFGSSSPGRSMDVGCGGGRLVEALSQFGFDAYGVEPNKKTVLFARKVGREISTENITELRNEYYTCVSAIHVLEHALKPSSFISHLYRILKPGGICIIEVPNFESKASINLGANWIALHPGTHLFHFTPGTLSALLEDAGFIVHKTQLLGGSGVFKNVSGSVVHKSSDGKKQKIEVKKGSYSPLNTLWKSRSALKRIPFFQSLVRRINWELLGHGEYVQITAIKPR